MEQLGTRTRERVLSVKEPPRASVTGYEDGGRQSVSSY